MTGIDLLNLRVTDSNERLPGIYIIVNKENSKVYVGQSKKPGYRLAHHKYMLTNNKHENKYLQASFNKHKESSFIFCLLQNFGLNELTYKEGYFLSLVDENLRYNLHAILDIVPMSQETKRKISAGNKNKILSVETKKRISEAKKGTIVSIETKEKLSKLHKGKVFSLETKEKLKKKAIGRKHTEETKKKLSKLNKGKTHTIEAKNKISKKLKGRYFSDDTRSKLSKARKGKNHTEESKKKISEKRIGIKLSEEHKRKISEGLQRRKSIVGNNS
jgi:group I intron endonuclease